mmetsp:Transcript_10470/g.7359  ORF Transcript_10470/g.7359 Transcript_10470/m.7359 type:complete len:175 (+) Transcript_10470:279-803(+)
MVTAEFTHGDFRHIFFNMCALLVFGCEIEQAYGTLFYAVINVYLMLLSIGMDLLFDNIVLYHWPVSLGGGSISYLTTCAVGYSNILFGIFMLQALTGDKYATYFGFKIRKIIIPIVYIIAISFAVENASFTGHLFGIVAALILRFCGLYNLRLLPQFHWIDDFETSSKCIEWMC